MAAQGFVLDKTAVFRVVTDEHRRQMCEIRCDLCGKRARKGMKPYMPPAAAARPFRRSGWEVDNDGRAAVCPRCIRAKPLKTTVGERAGLEVVQTTKPIVTDESVAVRRASLAVAPAPTPTPTTTTPQAPLTRDEVRAFIVSELEHGARHCKQLLDDVLELGGTRAAYEAVMRRLDVVYAREQAYQGRIFVALAGSPGAAELPGEPYVPSRRKDRTVPSPAPKPAPTAAAAPAQAPKPTPPTPPRAEASSTSMRAHRQLYRLLEDHFILADGDPPVGTYDRGWDDERVAKETELAIDEVVRVRRAAFGDLHDPELETIRQSQARLREDLARLKAERDRFDDLVRASSASLEQVDAAVREIERRARR